MTNATADVLVVGAGHNALVCAGYLAKAGLEVIVLEARDVIGGNTVTEELTLPGWHHDSCSSAHVVLQSNPLIRADELGLLEHHGLEYLVTDPAVVTMTEQHGALVIPPDLDRAVAEFARFSTRDADALRRMIEDWDGGLARVHAHVSAGLPIPPGPEADRYEALRARSAWGVVHDTFEHPAVRQAMMWLAFATIQPPRRPGTGALPAAITAGRLRFGWSTPVGGSGALPAALRRQIEAAGGLVVTGAEVDEILSENGRAVAVRTVDGRRFNARRAVVTASHLAALPQLLGEATPPDVADAAAAWRPGLALFAVHLALRADVRYRTPVGAITAVAGGIGSPEGLARQVDRVFAGELERDDPWILVVSSTSVDPSRAPGGVLKFLTVAPTLLAGREWEPADADAYARRLVEIVQRYVEGLDDDDILAMSPESPATLATHNPANIGGSCHGGEFLLDDGRIIPGWTDYRTGLDGLYLTGSTSHPGGSVSGRPGRNAARVVLGDLGIDPATVMPGI